MPATGDIPKPSIALIGAGLAGTSLILALHRQGYAVAGIASRSLASAQHCANLLECAALVADPATVIAGADLVIIATPDSRIQAVCEQLATVPGWSSEQCVCHLSGALDTGALDAARLQGARVIALHPAQTFADPQQGAQSLQGAYFALQGDPGALVIGRQLVADLNGHSIEIDKQQKPLYHAALCVASNYLVSLADTAVQMLRQTGMDESSALPLVLPLMQGTLDNLKTTGLPGALTGPISRGDADTVRKHLAALHQGPPELLACYRELGQQAQRVARAKGQQDPEGAKALADLLR